MQRVTDHLARPVDRERHRLLSGQSRVRVLEVLRGERTPLSVAELAAQVDLHPNTIRLHLDQLVEADLASRAQENRGRPGRPRWVYTAVAALPARDTGAASTQPEYEESRYKILAEVLVNHLEHASPEPAAEATTAGRAWGRAMSQETSVPPTVQQATIDLAELLDDLGFAPRTTGPGQTIELHRCPFRHLAEEHLPVVCGVHLGLMQGALAKRGAPMRARGLEPFVTPQLCLAHFDTKEPSKN